MPEEDSVTGSEARRGELAAARGAQRGAGPEGPWPALGVPGAWSTPQETASHPGRRAGSDRQGDLK